MREYSDLSTRRSLRILLEHALQPLPLLVVYVHFVAGVGIGAEASGTQSE